MDKRGGLGLYRAPSAFDAQDTTPPLKMTDTSAANGSATDSPHPTFWALTLGSIGVVYGDIGTSPLYALRESVLAAGGPNPVVTEAVILGILSLIIWALILIVTVKYVLILLRADRAAPQPQAQQGVARAQCDPDHRLRGHSARRPQRPRSD